jgi:hypothetical protein
VEPEGASQRRGQKEEGGQEEQRERVQPLGGSRSGAPRSHRRRSEGDDEVTGGSRSGDEDGGAGESAVGGHDGRETK